MEGAHVNAGPGCLPVRVSVLPVHRAAAARGTDDRDRHASVYPARHPLAGLPSAGTGGTERALAVSGMAPVGVRPGNVGTGHRPGLVAPACALGSLPRD